MKSSFSPSPPPPPPSCSSNTYNFQEVAMIPNVNDGIAIAKILLPQHTKITSIPQASSSSSSPSSNKNVKTIILNAPCLIGHRFAIRHFSPNEKVNSWGLPFGHVVSFKKDDEEEEEMEVSSSPCLLSSFDNIYGMGGIMPGDVLMNQAMYKALHDRLGVHQQHQRLKKHSSRQQNQKQKILELKGDDDSEETKEAAHHYTMEDEMLLIEQLLSTQPINFIDLDVSPDQPFLLQNCQELNIVGDDNNSKPLTRDKNKYTLPTFLGYKRKDNRGVGTRNHVILLSLTSSSSSILQPLLHRWSHYENNTSNFDGVRIVTHTEGECLSKKQHNLKHILRCIAGFMIHPNVGGVVVVSTGREVNVTRDILMEFVMDCNQSFQSKNESGREEEKGHKVIVPYPTCCFEEPHAQWIEYLHPNSNQDEDGNFLTKLDQAVQKAVTNATQNNTLQRTPCPLSSLTLALQCGGSDSFSGLTGNPLAGAITSHFIHNYQSRAILAESPELIGAEPYILSNVSSHDVATKFLEKTENYKKYAQVHDQSAAGNPSGGNLYRGLYNIVLKSLGAARKKAGDVTLDCILDYGEPMMRRRNKTKTKTNKEEEEEEKDEENGGNPPYYAFMDSPGNDLESIAGQVSSQCNLILFITGNGSLSNFPFVPTIKIVTTSARFELLKNEMDVDAGLFGNDSGDGRGREVLESAMQLCLNVASGRVLSKGELAGHYQVSIWRNWALDTTANTEKEDGIEKKEKMTNINKDAENKNIMEENTVLQLCSKNAPHRIRPDLPPLPTSLIQHAPIKRRQYNEKDHNLKAKENNKEKKESYDSRNNIFRPWSYGATRSLIPTSLCSSAVAQNIRESIILASPSPTSSSPTINHHIACPSHTEGCGAAGDTSSERILQRLLLGHALHPSVDRVLFLEHGCEKTHNDFFQMVLNESGVLGFLNEGKGKGGGDTKSASKGYDTDYDWSEFFDFWSLQNDGGYEAAKAHAMDYFGAKNDGKSHCQHPNARLFGIPWHERPLSVGVMIDSAAVIGCNGEDDDVASPSTSSHQLAIAVSHIVRLLSFLNVTPILPVNSPLVNNDTTSTAATVSAPIGTTEKEIVSHGIAPSTSGDMEDYFSSSPTQRKPSGPINSNKSPSIGNAQATKKNKHIKNTMQRQKVSAAKSTVSTIFAAETLVDATIPTPTLLPGQMIQQQNYHSLEQKGLHIMEIPHGATWDETISCLSPSCDVMLLIASPSNMSILPGSCLVPTLRRAIPIPKSLQNNDDADVLSWSRWTVDTCSELLDVLHSPLVCGGEKEEDDKLNKTDRKNKMIQRIQSLFLLPTFVVPRGKAVSM